MTMRSLSSNTRPDRMTAIALGALLAAAAVITAQTPAELIIRNGLVVNVDGRRQADVRIRNGVIAEIGPGLSAAAGAREIDARGRLLVPGGVDPHSHPAPERPAQPDRRVIDDYTTVSAAALAGGVTTVTNFVSRQPNEDVGAFLDRHIALVEKAGIADFLLHVNIGSDPSWVTPQALQTMVSKGYTSTKTFMREPYFDANAAGFVKAFRASGLAGVLSMIHCEDASTLTELTERMVAEGRGSLTNLSLSRPVVTEELAIQRAVAISETTGAPIYIVHLSSERGLRAAEAGQARGLPIYVETRPMLIHLNESRLINPDAGLYAGSPPIRSKKDVDALWDGMARGSVHTVGTDHGVRTREEKVDPALNVITRREGVSNIQHYRALLYSEGVRTGRISAEQFVAVTSTNPAKLFGLYPRKGAIQVGSDADIAIWDPNLKRTIRDADELSAAGWSLYDGWEVTGWATTTIRRGEIVYQDGKVIGKAGTGKMIPQAKFTRPNLSWSW